MVGAQFVTVGDTELDLQDIKLENDNKDAGSSIKWWDSKTHSYTYAFYRYYYYIYPDGDTEHTDKDAWTDVDEYIILDKKFVPGEGFWFTAGTAGSKIVTSGQVDMPATPNVGFTVDAKNEQIMVINPFPVELSLQDIKLENDNKDAGSSIKWWDSKTHSYTYAFYRYYYYIYPDGDTEHTDKDAWTDVDEYINLDKSFAPGEGFWFTAGTAGSKIKFVNPFYEAK